MERKTSLFLLQLILHFHVIEAAHGGLTCLSCLTSPVARDCPYVAHCGPNESCYLDSYVTPAGTISHEMGCRDNLTCKPFHGKRSTNITTDRRSSGDLLVCSECCQGDLCNSALCGQTGYPTVEGKRGPVCYNCDQQSKPDTCNIITLCEVDEVCSLMSFKSQVVKDDTLYTSECKTKQTCDAILKGLHHANSILIGKRYSDHVFSVSGNACLGLCCDKDLCTTNCAAGCKDPSYTFIVGTCVKESTDRLNYHDAKRSCRSDGGKLVTVKSQTMLDELSKITNHGAPFKRWIGLQRDAPMSSHFHWVDGTRLTIHNGAQFWDPGQPNNGNGTQDCGVVTRHHDRSLHLADYHCDRELKYICEMKL